MTGSSTTVAAGSLRFASAPALLPAYLKILLSRKPRVAVGGIPRIEASLRRIAAFKATAQPPPPFDPKRLRELSMEVAELNRKLNYVYGGKI